MTSRKKVLVITRNLPPLVGGMERLNQQVIEALQQEFTVAVCGPNGCTAHTGVSLCDEFPAYPAWRYIFGSFFSALKMAIKFKPDLVYAGSGLAAHAAIIAGYIARAPVVTYLHGLDIITPNAIYQICFLPIIRRSDAFIVNSNNTSRLAIQSGISENQITIIHPGVALPENLDRMARSKSFRETYGLGIRPTLLSVGRLTSRKGLVEFIDRCMPAITAALPSVCLIIIGDAPAGALGPSTGDIVEDIHAAIKKNGLNQQVRLLGKVSDEDLYSAYCAADLFVFPVLDIPGDVEGFGMVAIEASAYGLPTTGFAVGGIPDAVAEGVSGTLARSADYAQLTNIILRHLSSPDNIWTDACKKHAESFSWLQFGKKMRSLCTTVIKGFSGR